MKKAKIINSIKDFLIITFGAVLAAAAIYFFMLPSHVAVGSASALAMVLGNFIPLPVSMITLAINVFLLIMGFILIAPEFGAKTVYTSIMVPVSMGVFEIIFPNFQSLTQDPLIDVLCYILVVGMAMAILFSRNASSGGLDIVAKLMNYLSHLFKQKMNVGFSEYLRTLRINYAITLFDNGLDSIKNVALLSGFSDPLYFSSVFKKTVGKSPKDYICAS